MRDNNVQIGGSNNKQTITNSPNKKSWQDNIPLFITISLGITVVAGIILSYLGFAGN